MDKKCGNCEFWDKDNAINSPYFMDRKLSQCKFPVPISVPKTCTYNDQGQDCPLYVERQDAVEQDDDRPDENGYTRADDKDDQVSIQNNY